MKVIFLDTNIFLQCRDLKDLPWQDIADNHDLLLLVPRTVQEEIDKQKSDGNTRRGKRARKISALFRDIILSDHTSLVIRASEPHIEISFPDMKGKITESIETLDLTRADDRIINEVNIFKQNNNDKFVCLLTHDTNPMLTCKNVGIPFTIVPDDWLLPPEPDTRDKRIHELEQKLKQLERIYPIIEVSVHDDSDNAVASASLCITRYNELDEKDVAHLVAEASKIRPIWTDFQEQDKPALPPSLATSRHLNSFLGIEWNYEKVSEKEIEAYRNNYEKWLSELKDFYERLHSNAGFSERHYTIEFKLFNNGTLPAENLVIQFNAVGGLRMITLKGRENLFGKVKVRPPAPPAVPEGRWIQRKRNLGIFNQLSPYGSASRMAEVMRSHIDIPKIKRDRNAFYWKKDKDEFYTDEWIFECEEFRHQVGSESFIVVVFVPPKEEVLKGGISCLVTAKNLPVPVQTFFPINIVYNQADTLEIAKGLLPETLPVFKIKEL